MIKIVFVSNYFNHHQSSLSDALYRRKDIVDYHFIETIPMEAERKNMGWQPETLPPYVLSAYQSDAVREKCMKLIREADCVIVGSDMSLDRYMVQRHREKGFIFRCSERFYRHKVPMWQLPLRFVKNYWRFGRFKNEYLLCSSAFTAADAALTHSFMGKTYRWGYFPETKNYDSETLCARKREKSVVTILWVGRLLPLKHPEFAIVAAKHLKTQNIPFSMRIIGAGEMEETIRRMIQDQKLSDHVEMLGFMSPEEVRAHMEQADIYLFTSDRQEGWGAVLNESMNSGCAVVASHVIGSVPFLIQDGKNGFIYRDGDEEQFCRIIEKLAGNSSLREKTGSAAYSSIISEWNAEIAAERLILLYEDLKATGKSTRFQTGPCSPAPILPDDWFFAG